MDELPLPTDLLKYIIGPMVYSLEHNDKYVGVLTELQFEVERPEQRRSGIIPLSLKIEGTQRLLPCPETMFMSVDTLFALPYAEYQKVVNLALKKKGGVSEVVLNTVRYLLAGNLTEYVF